MRTRDDLAQIVGQELGCGEILLCALSSSAGLTRVARMRRGIFWFRNDLRLHDNRALAAAAAHCDELSLVYCHDHRLDQPTRWSTDDLMPQRMGEHRRRHLRASLSDLQHRLQARGQWLQELHGDPIELLQREAEATRAECIYAERIDAPEEQAIVAALLACGLKVELVWQSSLLEPTDLPFDVAALPRVFTQFRHAVERAGVRPRGEVELLDADFPPPISARPAALANDTSDLEPAGECAALAHLEAYFASTRPQVYKETRNGLLGHDYSTRLSPWLASGALSPRRVFRRLQQHEQEQGANESTYWIWFELLWRDYFRFLHQCHGVRLYGASGLSPRVTPQHDARAFARWCRGDTGDAFIDAGMRELAQSGELSNRMRQNVASFLLNDLGCDWRAGAAWFEAQLIDYDVYSNTGNWLYLAGKGTDPRGGRRFEPRKQAATYDPDGRYRARWLTDGR